MNRSYAKPHLLVIDDSPDIHNLLHAILEEDNWIVTGCGNSRSAVECVRDEQPDVVLLDLRLGPQQTGWGVLQALQEDRLTAGIPVVLFTGELQIPAEKETWLKEHHIQVLSKPFDIADLYGTLETAVRPAVSQA